RVLVGLADDIGKDPIVGQHLGGEREKKHRRVREQKSSRGRDQVWERTPWQRAPVHLADPAQARGERSIGSVTMRKYAQTSIVDQLRGECAFWRRLENEIRILAEERIDLRIVLLRLERARAINQ